MTDVEKLKYRLHCLRVSMDHLRASLDRNDHGIFGIHAEAGWVAHNVIQLLDMLERTERQ